MIEDFIIYFWKLMNVTKENQLFIFDKQLQLALYFEDDGNVRGSHLAALVIKRSLISH